MANLAKVITVSKEAMVTLRMAAAMVAQVMAGAAMAKGAATVAQVTAEEDMAPVTAGAAMVAKVTVGAAMVGRVTAGAAEADTVVGDKKSPQRCGLFYSNPPLADGTLQIEKEDAASAGEPA
jgi:hypothetical protein